MSEPNGSHGRPTAYRRGPTVYQPSHARQGPDLWERSALRRPQADDHQLDMDRKAGPLAWSVFAGIVFLLIAGLVIGAYLVFASDRTRLPNERPAGSAPASPRAERGGASGVR